MGNTNTDSHIKYGGKKAQDIKDHGRRNVSHTGKNDVERFIHDCKLKSKGGGE